MPIRTWTFENKPVIRIGRCSDNDVILYSSVVSRYHVELRHNHHNWEIINLGSNGTYLNGKQITQINVVNGLIINVALSGPKIALYLDNRLKEAEIKQKQNYHQQEEHFHIFADFTD